MNVWILTTEKLPEKSGHYLVTVRGKTREGYFRNDTRTWRLANRDAHKIPAIDNPKFKKKYKKIEEKLLVLVGYGLEDIFPEEVRRNRARLAEINEQERYFSQPIENVLSANEKFLLQSPEAQIFEAEKVEIIEKALLNLTPREEKVLKMRFGLKPYSHPFTWEEIGQRFAVTTTRVQQIETKALNKLRHSASNNSLKKVFGDY